MCPLLPAPALVSPTLGMQLICSQIAGGTLASFDTNTILGGNIPQTYSHLRVVYQARGDTAANTSLVTARFNNDSGTNYDYMRIENATASTLAAIEGIAQTSGVCGYIAAATATASHAGISTIEIPFYAGATWFKQYSSTGNITTTTTTGGQLTYLHGGKWRNTAAITRLALIPAAGNFIAGSGFWVYGIL